MEGNKLAVVRLFNHNEDLMSVAMDKLIPISTFEVSKSIQNLQKENRESNDSLAIDYNKLKKE